MKKLSVNCSTCDMRFVKEDTLNKYEKVTINAAQIITSQETNQLIAAYNVSINAAKVELMDRDVKHYTINGSSTINGCEALGERKALTVNGKLEIMPDAASVLPNYVSILVNGIMTYPDNLEGLLGCATVNGKREAYPANAILLPNNTKIDRIFTLRAQSALYYAPKLLFVDGALDADNLVAKGVHFQAKKAILAEALVEKIMPILSDSTELSIVPDGAAYVTEDATLDDSMIRRFGNKLYVDGDLNIFKEGENALAQIQYLHVNGTVRLDKDLQNSFYALKAEYKSLKLIDTNIYCVNDMPTFVITKDILNRYPMGISITDCVKVIIEDDVTPDLLKNLTITDVAMVICAKEMIRDVQMICSDVASISSSDSKENKEEKDEDIVTINTATCTL